MSLTWSLNYLQIVIDVIIGVLDTSSYMRFIGHWQHDGEHSSKTKIAIILWIASNIKPMA